MHDKRLNAFRPDLADARLRGKVEAERFVAGRAARIVAPVADLRREPSAKSGMDTQLIAGDDVQVFEERDGWAWLQAERDGYVGYVPDYTVGPVVKSVTHVVTAPRTFVYVGPDLRFPTVQALSMGSRITVVDERETRGTRYFLLDGGQAIIANHCAPLDSAFSGDYVAIAGRFLETPYLWGGRSGFGIDCSGLVQLSMLMAGRLVPRDTDMQEKGLGNPIGREELRRGDLVFWKGHVAIMEDDKTLLHANGHTMNVSHEGLEEAIHRIGWLYDRPTSYRRP